MHDCQSVLCYYAFPYSAFLSSNIIVFLPCDALRCTVLVIVILSVRPSVGLSVCHTRGLCPHGSTYDHDSFQVIQLSMTFGIFQGHLTVSRQISQKRCVIRQKLL